MARYHDPAKVEELGTPTTPRLLTEGKQPHVPEGLRLVVVRDDGTCRVASDATILHDWQSAWRSVAEGVFYTIKGYYLTEQQLKQCPDTGRAPSLLS